MPTPKPTTVNDYLATFPKETQTRLKQIRAAIKATVPAATEAISYGIPAFNYEGRYLVYFAGYKNHVSMYPVPAGDPELDKLFAPYHTSGKGTIQFPLDKPLPISLIKKIVKALIQRNRARAAKKKAK